MLVLVHEHVLGVDFHICEACVVRMDDLALCFLAANIHLGWSVKLAVVFTEHIAEHLV